MYLPASTIYGLSTGALVAVVLLALVELVLIVWAVLDIVQRPAVLGGQKWIWLVVVVLFGIIGPIVYFAVGRAQPPVPEKEADQTPGTDRASHAADLLYGPRPQEPPDDGTSRE